MASLVFVHGIGVRKPTQGEHPYAATCRAIGWELFRKSIDWSLVKCLWGDKVGARLLAGGVSLPPERRGKLGVPLAPDDPAGLWAVLFDDPTFELRALAEMPEAAAGAVAGGPPGAIPAWIDVPNRLAAGLASQDPEQQQLKTALDERLERLQLTASFAQALVAIQRDPAMEAAIRHPEAVRAIARAIVARTVGQALDEGLPAPGLADLEAIESDVQQLLRKGQLAGLRGWAKSVLLGWGTTRAQRSRAALMSAATPLAGDVIFYQAHGDCIREEIRKAIMGVAADEPVAVLAHSLGGVATTEALCEDAALRKRVRKLVTAGSQPGFFYEINALRTLPFGEKLPADFPDWLNFWDSRDFLSFVVEDVFAGGGTRCDVEVNSGLPFPASHSGYWRQSLTWERLEKFLAGRH